MFIPLIVGALAGYMIGAGRETKAKPAPPPPPPPPTPAPKPKPPLGETLPPILDAVPEASTPIPPTPEQCDEAVTKVMEISPAIGAAFKALYIGSKADMIANRAQMLAFASSLEKRTELSPYNEILARCLRYAADVAAK